MNPTCFEVEIEDDVARIEACRPDRLNSMTPEFWNELPQIVEEIDNQGSARAIVISSTGKHFTAGMDLAVFTSNDTLSESKGVTRGATVYDFVKVAQRTISSLANCRMPVLAAAAAKPALAAAGAAASAKPLVAARSQVRDKLLR